MWRLLPDLQAGAQYQGRVLRIKGLRRQGVSAVCFDSFLLTSEPHSHLATFYPSSGSEPPPLTTLFRPSTFECVDYPETHFCSAQAFAFKRLEPASTKPYCQSSRLRMQSVYQIPALGLAERFGLPACHTFGYLCLQPFAIAYLYVHGLHSIMIAETTMAVDD